MSVIDLQSTDRWRLARLHTQWAEGAGARDKWRAACDELVRRLARSRGWLVAQTPFNVSRLRGWRHVGDDFGLVVDHPEHFRWPTRPYRPAALLTHTYVAVAEIEAFATRHGLRCEVLPWSWYYPGRCTAALLTGVVAERDEPRPTA